MKKKIKEIHNKLSNVSLKNYDSVVTADNFTSVLRDRFISELKKMNIEWDLMPTTINDLTSKKSIIKKNNPIENSSSENLKNNKVGIDIQHVKEMPVVKDPWVEEFYINNFNKNEIAHCLKKKDIYQSFAGLYAVKEAIFKIDGTSGKSIKINFDQNGKPLNSSYSISISHDNGFAVAVAFKNETENLEKNIEDIRDILKIKDANINKKLKTYFFTILLLIVIIICLLFEIFSIY